MAGESNLTKLIESLSPKLNYGEYVFVSLSNVSNISREETLFEFKEEEGITIIIEREKADLLRLTYDFIASWITLTVHSSLDAVGLTATFSAALAKHKISCNVVAGYFHDHIFVSKKDEDKAMEVLKNLSEDSLK